MQRQYYVVDVFTRTALEGNPLAVFPDARGLDAALMQRIARELNLSETTFVFPPSDPGVAADVRIFTPRAEMEFAGHPTIGTAYVLRLLGLVPAEASTFALGERVGPIAVRVDEGDDSILWLTTPEISSEGAYDRAACAAALGLGEDDLVAGLPCELLTAGNPNVFVPLKDAATVDRVVLNEAALARLFARRAAPACLFAFAAMAEGAYSRMFAPALGVAEDPATGSATGPLAAYMMAHGLVANGDGTRFTSEQGTKMGRRSILHVLVHGTNGSDGIEIGGNVAPFAIAELDVAVGGAAAP